MGDTSERTVVAVSEMFCGVRCLRLLYGAGKYQYELVEDWAKLPKDWNFLDVTGIAVDENDRLYVLNRSEHPMIVLDRAGSVVDSWG